MAATIDAPAYTVEVDFGAGYVTVPNLRTLWVKRGRQDQLADIQAGECVVLLGNPTGDLSPDNAGGSHYPNVEPLRPFRLSATYNALTYRLFTGYVQEWRPVDNTVVDSDVAIHAIDFFKQLNLATLTTSLPAQDEQARIGAVLDAVTTAGLTRNLDAGLEPVLAATLVQVKALRHIQEVLAGERGIFFVAGDGQLTFHNRHHRYVTAAGYTSQATFGQSAGQLYYLGLEYVLDDQYIYNDIQVNPSGTGEGIQVAGDATSKGKYWPRTLGVDAPWLAAGQGATLAGWLLYCYKDKHPRMPSITLDAEANTAGLHPQQLGRELGDRITVLKSGPGSLGINRDLWIEGIEHSYDAGGARGLVTKWLLNDVGLGGPTPFRLQLSALNSGDVLIY